MPAAARVDPKDFFTYEEWTPLVARSSWKGLILIAHAWGLIIAAAAMGVIWPWLIPLSVMIIGARQLGLAILMHEAAHAGLHSSPRVNDFAGQWLCAVPIGANLSLYRPYHLQHHKYAQQPEDPDLVLSAPFPVSRASMTRKMIRDLTGQTFFKQRILPLVAAATKRRSEDAPPGAAVTAQSIAPFLLVNLTSFVALSVFGLGWTWFVFWLLPMATWFPLVTRLRNIAEHAVVPDNADPLRHARTTHANPIEGLLIAPYWVNYHCEHHMFMFAPCWSLPKIHRLLKAKGVTERMEVQKGYAGVLAMASSSPAA